MRTFLDEKHLKRQKQKFVFKTITLALFRRIPKTDEAQKDLSRSLHWATGGEIGLFLKIYGLIASKILAPPPQDHSADPT